MYKLKSQLFYLKRRFNIDLWAEVIRKKNWKTSQSKRFLIRIERFILLGAKDGGVRRRFIKRKSLNRRDFVSHLRAGTRKFKATDDFHERVPKKQQEFEFSQYFKRSSKFFKIIKILNLKQEYRSLFNSHFNNKYNFQFYSNLYNNLFLLTNYLFSKQALLGKKLIKPNQYSYNFSKNFETFKYRIYLRRHLPTKLWNSAYVNYYAFRYIKKPWVWSAATRKKSWWIEKNKLSRALLVYYGFGGNKKKFFYLKNNFFKKKIWAKSSSLYLNKLIINILYKTNFFKTFRQTYTLIKTTGIFINNSLIKNPYTLCSVGKVLSFPNYTKYFLIKNYYNNLYHDNLIINNWPAYFEVNLKTLSIVLWREPSSKELKRFIANYISNSLLWF